MRGLPSLHGLNERQLALIEPEFPAVSAQVSNPRTLRLPELSRWALKQARSIARNRHVDAGGTEFLLSQSLKLGEEVGELYAELLALMKHQRTDKQDRFSAESLSSEFADVLICTAILAELAGVDLDQAVQAKMSVVEARLAK